MPGGALWHPLDPSGVLEGSRVPIWRSFGTLRGPFLARFGPSWELGKSEFIMLLYSVPVIGGVWEAEKLRKALTVLIKK